MMLWVALDWILPIYGGFQSGRRDSDPRISAWKADALPLGHARIFMPYVGIFYMYTLYEGIYNPQT